MKKLKEYKGIIILILVIILGAFYWFELRQTLIRKECIKENPNAFYIISEDTPGRIFRNSVTSDKAGYENCLRKHGLEN